MTYQEWLSRLHGVRPSGDGHVALCPGHDDTRTSLSTREQNGWIECKCFAGCAKDHIVASLGLERKDLRTEEDEPAAAPARSIVATYDYRDESGQLLYQAVRYQPKDFRQRRPDPERAGSWIWNLKGVRRVLYRLPEIRERLRRRPQPVLWVEGEGDADQGWAFGVPTTTIAGGAKALAGHAEEYLAQLAWTGATTVTCGPDHDAPGWGLMREIATKALAIGFLVFWLELDGLAYKGDLSDWIAAGHTAEQLTERLAAARPILTPEDIPPVPAPPTSTAGPASPDDNGLPPTGVGYRVQDGGLWREKLIKGQVFLEELAPNFTCWIAEERILDDGLHEPEKELLLEGRLASGERCPPVAVPAAEVERLTWLAKAWPEACDLAIGQNTGAHLHRAMRRLRPGWPRRRIFTHTGWREIAGQWAYVTAEGAVGSPEAVEVDLEPKLRPYALPMQPIDLALAVRTSLTLWTIGPLALTVPLWACVYRAPLCEVVPVDFLAWAEGQSGTFKTSTALLALAHFGRFSDKRDIPASWLDTATRLEQRAHAVKDGLLVIDDYIRETDDLESKAIRMVRALGNATSRGRMTRDLKAQPDWPPRGLVLSTAEHRPSGLSLSARMLILTFEPGAIDRGRLTALQRAAWRLPHALAGYCHYLAPRLADRDWRAGVRTLFEHTRDRIREEAGPTPLRVPEVLAHLWLGIEYGLQFVESIGVLDAAQAEVHRTTAWTALLGVQGSQTAEIEGQRETRRFLHTLLSILSTGGGKLLPQSDSGEGYAGRTPLLGWSNDRALMLIPDAAYGAVQGALRTAGRPLQLDLERLLRSLVEDGVALKDAEGRLRRQAKIAGKPRRVLYLIRERCAVLMDDNTWLGAHAPDATPEWVEETPESSPEGQSDAF